MALFSVIGVEDMTRSGFTYVTDRDFILIIFRELAFK